MNNKSFNFQVSHRRLNILTNEWILVSPQRSLRPWDGQTEKPVSESFLPYSADCKLCPGNKRTNGEINPKYSSTFVFNNDNQAIIPLVDEEEDFINPFFQAKSEYGKCRVLCYSPQHDKTMANFSPEEIQEIILMWQKQYQELGSDPKINHVQIFENRGAIMGCSNPHPHGQIWSQSSLPNEIIKEQNSQFEYFQKNKTKILLDYAKEEIKKKERLVFQNKSFIAVVPFWAVWPFETLVIPLSNLSDLSNLSTLQIQDLAATLSVLTKAYNQIFSVSFPYSMGIHQSPTDKKEHPEWQLHFHFYPPLLRSALVKKFMVGYEMLCEPQRDLTPESAAQRLRSLVNGS